MARKKILRDMAREFPGWTVELRKSGHVRLTHTSGAVYFTGSSPSDFRAWRKLVADIRRIEREVDRSQSHQYA